RGRRDSVRAAIAAIVRTAARHTGTRGTKSQDRTRDCGISRTVGRGSTPVARSFVLTRWARAAPHPFAHRRVTYSDIAVIRVGQVYEIVRYPVKSMAGTATASAFLGWHGLDGDRRFAFRRVGDASGFPWLTASRVPELLLSHPAGLDESTGGPLPTQVRTPAGSRVELGSAELKAELARRFGGDIELIKLKHGIFDEAAISVIGLAT